MINRFENIAAPSPRWFAYNWYSYNLQVKLDLSAGQKLIFATVKILQTTRWRETST